MSTGMVVAHFFEYGQRREPFYVGASREAQPLKWPARQLSAWPATITYSAIDEKAWAGPRPLGPRASGFSPHVEPCNCHGEQLESRVTRGARVRSSFLERGLDRSPFAAGRGKPAPCSPANGTPEGLRENDCARPLRGINITLKIALNPRLPVSTNDFTYRNVRQKFCWGALRSELIRHTGRPAKTVCVTSPGPDRGRSRLKDTPNFLR